jgi:hypothetical protein
MCIYHLFHVSCRLFSTSSSFIWSYCYKPNFECPIAAAHQLLSRKLLLPYIVSHLQIDFCIEVILALHLLSSSLILSSLHLSELGLSTVCGLPLGVISLILISNNIFYSKLIHSFNMSKPSQSTFLNLVLYFYFLCLQLSLMCMLLILPLQVSPIVASENFISTACNLPNI